MGIKRVVDTDFWTDEKVEVFEPDEKLFWVYLLTNPYTKQLGIYHITKKQMSFQLGYDVEQIERLLDKFENEYGLIKFVDSEIAIFNFLKHSILKGGKPVEDCLKADIKKVKHKELIDMVFERIIKDGVNVSETVLKVIADYKESTKETNTHTHTHTQYRGRIVNDSPTYRDSIPVYDPSKNREMSEEQETELLKLMKGQA